MAHALFAKKMMAHIHKTDKLDATGLTTLVHLGSIPTVCLPPGEIRDDRELHRTRMAFTKKPHSAEEAHSCHTCQICSQHLQPQ